MNQRIEFNEQPLGEGAHWRRFYDSRVLRWYHLPPRDITLTIEMVTQLDAKVGRESKKQLMIRFRGATLPFALNATNATTIAQLWSDDPHQWVGKRVVLYVTTTEMAGKTVQCIRIRPQRPGRKQAAELEPALDMSATNPEQEPRSVIETSGELSPPTEREDVAADPESDGR